ncbi:hypothetical protein AALP_AA1G259800 [Arabis alpina]|uniref:Uncharacterized protein n=1 Tax=Arabis alpina TaxID=50452 RepID=A0A087HQR3_ARAAL|nr:hypothetical protein AALP_AA1G259800 [Arabis alpina]
MVFWFLSLAHKFVKLQTLILRQEKPQPADDNTLDLKLTDHSLNSLNHVSLNTALAYFTIFCLKLKILNLSGCAIRENCNQMQSLNLGWCENTGNDEVMSLAYGCPDLRTLDLFVVALANWCVHLRSLGLYYCRNITDIVMYEMWRSVKKGKFDEERLRSLNISQCTYLTPSADQAVCDTFFKLHTYSCGHSLHTCTFYLYIRFLSLFSSLYGINLVVRR